MELTASGGTADSSAASGGAAASTSVEVAGDADPFFLLLYMSSEGWGFH